jgi:hypothetical protein
MFCPMLLDCQTMTGVVYNCPNVLQCLQFSPINRNQAMLLYCLNVGVNVSNIKVDGQPLEISDILPSPSSLHRANFVYNTDYVTRDMIIFGTPVQWTERSGGAEYFYRLTVEKLQQLVELGFASLISRTNDSPMLVEFLTFALRQQSQGFEFTFQGDVISPFRQDYRVSLDAIAFKGTCSPQLIADFKAFVGRPDELIIKSHYLFAWWD